MDKPDERRRLESLDRSRDLDRNRPASKEPLVPEKAEKEYKRNPDITAAAQAIVEVLASEKNLMDSQAWSNLRQPDKGKLFNQINERISKQTGQPALRGEIGGRELESYLVLGQEKNVAKISVKESNSRVNFGREIARLHIFHYQENKLVDSTYAESREGQEVSKALSVGGNLGNKRTYTSTVQSAIAAGDAARAIIAGKLLKSPTAPEKNTRTKESTKKAPVQKSMDDRRLDIVNALFQDRRITDKKIWDSMKYRTSVKRKLFADLNEKIAERQDRGPLPAILGKRKTALYGDGGHRTASIRYEDAEDRFNFIKAIGQLNLRQFQELGREEPERYTELVTNAKTKHLKTNGDVEEHDWGMVNYSETERNKISRELRGTHRIDIQTLETILLGREITTAYGELTRIENDREQKKKQQHEKAREDSQSS